jgi:hypothetical protein
MEGEAVNRNQKDKMRKKKSETVDVVDLQDAMQRGQVPEPELGNETAPDAKTRRNGKLKSVDLPGMRGKGVERLEDAGLEALGDELDDLRTKKRKLAEKITTAEGKAIECMKELGIKFYRYSDREMVLSESKEHVKVKAVTVGDEEAEEED